MMTFNPEQKTLLAAPLSRANVRSRKQGGRDVSYIEGWRVIDEANRIFGFDGWTRETLDVKCVAERDRTIGDSKAPGFGVSYTAKVRIMAGDIIRDGIGAGHGIDRDLGQAHESAIKEAETDAMKRALMTFGNPFGLALYDKEQTNVEGYPDNGHKEAPKASSSPTEVFDGLVAAIRKCGTPTILRQWASKEENKKSRLSLPEAMIEKVDLAYGDKLAELQS